MSTQKSRSRNHRSKRQSGALSSRDLVTKKALSGGRFSPPTNPPDVTYMPWFPTTLVIAFPTKLEFTVNSVLTYLRSQLDPTKRGFNKDTKGDARFVVQYRLISIETWNLTGRVISLAVDDFTDSRANVGARDQLCGLVDVGSSVHTPCVGYKLPHAQQHHVLRTDDKQGDINLFDITTSDGQCVAYVKILWRFDGPLRHPTVLSPIDEIRNVVGEISNNISSRHNPSTMEITLHGIKYVAETVAVVSALSDLHLAPPAAETRNDTSEPCVLSPIRNHSVVETPIPSTPNPATASPESHSSSFCDVYASDDLSN